MNNKKQKLYNFIKNSELMTDEFMDTRITALEMISRQINDRNFIGIDVPLNFERHINDDNIYYYKNTNWQGFIPSDIKIIFGYGMGDSIINAGMYYYINDNNYLKDFINTIRYNNIDCEDEIDFTFMVKDFLDTYFTNLKDTNNKTRSMAFLSIVDNNGRYMEPTGRTNKTFYRNNIALCTEYATMAGNIMNFFGFETSVVIGSVDVGEGDEMHAFNFTILNGERYLIDFTIGTNFYDIDGKYNYQIPFYERVNDDDFYEFYNNKLDLNNYSVAVFPNNNYIIEDGAYRTYSPKMLRVENYYSNNKVKANKR